MVKIERLAPEEQRFLTPDRRPFTEAEIERLTQWMTVEVEDVAGSRGLLEREWVENLRRYEGVTKVKTKHIPYENAPNIEFTIGAMMCDVVYAQTTDLLHNAVDPNTVALPTNDKYVKHAEAIQDFMTWGGPNEWMVRQAAEDVFLDTIQQGTGTADVPWMEYVKKTGIHRTERRGPRVRAVPIEHFFISSGKSLVEDAQLVATRLYLRKGELNLYGQPAFGGWDIEKALPCGMSSWVQSSRERIGHVSSPAARQGDLFEVWICHVLFDIDDDGIDEDLYVVWDRTAKAVLKTRFSRFQRRPYTSSTYQKRAHLFHGMGVMEMTRPWQSGITMFANNFLANSYLANIRMWRGTAGMIPGGTVRVWAGRFFEDTGLEQMSELKLSDTYPSSILGVQMLRDFAEQRAGVSAMSAQRPSQVFGSRTPGVTALTAVQQVNKRFAGAFDSMRHQEAEMYKQCLYRYQERFLAGDYEAKAHVKRVMGNEKGDRIIEVLSDPYFDESLKVEMAASSASINREADRRAHLELLARVGEYYQKSVEMAHLIGSGQLSGGAKELAMQVHEKASALIERFIRTYPQVRDAERFIVKFGEEIDESVPVQQGDARLAELVNALGTLERPQGPGNGTGRPVA